jgi:excinuclease ABC subunit A
LFPAASLSFWLFQYTFKTADWVIDLGPEGGEEGGYIIAEGTPEQIVKNKKSLTREFLKRELEIK